MKRLLTGYKYTTTEVIRYGDWNELKKLARAENRNFRKQNRIDRLVVYPVPGPIAQIGQLCILR